MYTAQSASSSRSLANKRESEHLIHIEASMTTTKATRVQAERITTDVGAGDPLLDRVAWFMDSNFRLPGTKIRFGFDEIVGLIPGAGDLAAGGVQAALILLATYHYKLPRHVIVKMVLNSVLDTTVGSVPILGTIFDVAFKANMRNMKLLREHVARSQTTETSRY